MVIINDEGSANIFLLLTFASLACAWSVSLALPSRKSKVENVGVSEDTKYPVGPTPLPFLGNIFAFSAMLKRPDHELRKIADRYKSMCMMWFGRKPVLFINSPIVAKDLLDKKGMTYSSRPAQNSFRAEAWPWRLVTTPTGETFRLLRRVYHNLLGPKQSASFRKYQDFESKILLSTLLDRPEGFLLDVERFAMSVIFSACYGVRLAELDHPTMVEFYTVWEAMLIYFQPGSLWVDFLPILGWLPKRMQPWRTFANALGKRELKLHQAFLRTLQKQVRDGTAPQCFGTLLTQIQEEENINDDRACDILAMFIGAGADTSSAHLQTFFKVMALHPGVVQKAQEELDRVVGPSRLPTWDDEANLPYVRALIKEMHRWAPVGSIGIPHATDRTDIYKGQLIPEGTVVFPNLPALSRSSERYENPEEFAPERFLGDEQDASSSALDPDYRKRDHFHYGFGRRLCQGIFVAEAGLFIVISRVLWGFDVKKLPNAPPLEMGSKIDGLVHKPEPYQVSIKHRGHHFEQTMRDALAGAKTDILNFDDVEFEAEPY